VVEKAVARFARVGPATTAVEHNGLLYLGGLIQRSIVRVAYPARSI